MDINGSSFGWVPEDHTGGVKLWVVHTTTVDAYEPLGVGVDGAGNLYVADSGNYDILVFDLVGTNYVLAAKMSQKVIQSLSRAHADGAENRAEDTYPTGITVDAATNLYVTDSGAGTIRKITPFGTNWMVTAIGGLADFPGSADGVGNVAQFCRPVRGSWWKWGGQSLCRRHG